MQKKQGEGGLRWYPAWDNQYVTFSELQSSNRPLWSAKAHQLSLIYVDRLRLFVLSQLELLPSVRSEVNIEVLAGYFRPNKAAAEALQRISPLAWQHINFYGRYRFDSDLLPIDLAAMATQLAGTGANLWLDTA